MEEVESSLRGRGARLLVVETSSRADYTPTRRFYEKRGYERSAQLRDFYNQGDDRVVLTKALAVGREAESREPRAQSLEPTYE